MRRWRWCGGGDRPPQPPSPPSGETPDASDALLRVPGLVNPQRHQLTTEPLKWLRAIGLIVPLALGIGRRGLSNCNLPAVCRNDQRDPSEGEIWRWAWVIPVALIAWAGVNSARDFQAWVTSDDLYMPMEQHLYRGIDEIAVTAPTDTPVYFSPFTD